MMTIYPELRSNYLKLWTWDPGRKRGLIVPSSLLSLSYPCIPFHHKTLKDIDLRNNKSQERWRASPGMKSLARAIFTGVSPRKCGILIFHKLWPEPKGNGHRNEVPPLKSSPYPYCITWSWEESLVTIMKVTLTFQSCWTKVLSEGHSQILHRLPDLFKESSVYHDQAQELFTNTHFWKFPMNSILRSLTKRRCSFVHQFQWLFTWWWLFSWANWSCSSFGFPFQLSYLHNWI